MDRSPVYDLAIKFVVLKRLCLEHNCMHVFTFRDLGMERHSRFGVQAVVVTYVWMFKFKALLLSILTLAVRCHEYNCRSGKLPSRGQVISASLSFSE